ncbi:cannabinoid receptor 2 isoform X2 [Paroedura picta]
MQRCSMNKTTNASSCSSTAMPMECYMVFDDPTQKTVIAVLCCMFGSLCFLENTLVLYLIFSSRRIRNKPSYLFISSLAAADTLASVIFVFSFVNFHVFDGTDSSKEVFLLKLGGVTTSFTASLGSLLLMAFDRYICILKPSEYKVLITSRRALIALAVLWVTVIFIAFLPLFGWNCCTMNSTCSELFPFVDTNYLTTWIASVAILLMSILYAYVHVLWKARKHVLYMKTHYSQAGQQNTRMRMDITLAKTLVIVLVVLVMCWSPVLLLMTYSTFARLDDTVRKIFAFCCTLCLVNSMVNPAIYALRSRELYSSLRKICSCLGRMPGFTESNPEAESIQKSCPIETVYEDVICNTQAEPMKD